MQVSIEIWIKFTVCWLMLDHLSILKCIPIIPQMIFPRNSFVKMFRARKMMVAMTLAMRLLI